MNQTVYGLHAIKALLMNHPKSVQQLFLQQGRDDPRVKSIIQLAEQHSVVIKKLSKQELQELLGEAIHQGVAAVCNELPTWHEQDLLTLLEKLDEEPFLLILDGVQDPHNLGACLRSADAAGVHAVIAPKDKSAGLTAVARKVACGAAEYLPFIQVTNLVRTMKQLKEKNIWLFGAADQAEQSIYQTDLKGAVAVVMGAEGKGLRRLTRENCDVLMAIPMCGSVSSLNVSVATGVCLFEALRQRIFN